MEIKGTYTKDTANFGVQQTFDCGIGMLRRVHDMRMINDEGRAVVKTGQSAAVIASTLGSAAVKLILETKGGLKGFHLGYRREQLPPSQVARP